MKRAHVLIIALIGFYTAHAYEEKHLVAIISSYNNIDWYSRNLNSLAIQKYKNWRAIYIDDRSTDGTGDAVQDYLETYNLDKKVNLIRNRRNQGALHNIYNAIHTCNDNDIILIIDGDDWLADEHAFEHINELYQDKNVWLTYGKAQLYPHGGIIGWQAAPENVITTNSFRHCEWSATHLRTFYAELFKYIKKEDLLYEEKFFSHAGDVAIMLPMLEMAGTHIRQCPHVIYTYNMDNSIDNLKVRFKNLFLFDQVIRARKPYKRLEKLAAPFFS